MHFISLNDGVKIPVIGLGVWKSKNGKECYDAVLKALEIGYRHIDTAAIYGNEESVGKAIADSKILREELFITTKLWNSDQSYPRCLDALKLSLDRLGLSYVDLYLIHFPVTSTRKQAWKGLLELKEKKLTRSIGVSNYTVSHLQEMKTYSDVVPSVNQVEFHPFLNQIELAHYCKKENILIEAYSPLAHGQKVDDAELEKMGKSYGKTPAQILIRWSIQSGFAPLPKSVNPKRILENFGVFEFTLSDADFQKLNSMNSDLRTCWDPSDVK